MSNAAADEAVAAGLADTVEGPDQEPTIIDVDTSGERTDDDIAVDAEVLPLPVKLEPSEPFHGMSLVPVRDELKGLTELAVTLAIADNTPYALKGKPAAVLAVFLTGRELGIPPMTALRNLHVIDGKVTVNPKVRAAMVRREGLGKLWPHQGPREIPCPKLAEKKHNDTCALCEGTGKVARVCECGRSDYGDNDDELATWHAKRADDPFVIYSSTYTMGMARGVKIKNGTLADKDNWQHYPERMLSWRALGYLLDDAFPEVGTGLYSPDELGAITDEEGEPVIDVASTEVLTETASRAREARSGGSGGKPKADKDPPAAPDTITTFKNRIEKIKHYEGAPSALKALWQADDGNGHPKLPDIDQLRYRHCKMAAAMLDTIERRIAKGDFGEEITDAEIVEDGNTDQQPPADDPDPDGIVADQIADGVMVPDGNDAPSLWFDPATLPQERTPADDLVWCEQAGEELITEVAVAVQEIPADQLVQVMKLLDLSANGLTEPTKRARIAARRVRLKLERLAGL